MKHAWQEHNPIHSRTQLIHVMIRRLRKDKRSLKTCFVLSDVFLKCSLISFSRCVSTRTSLNYRSSNNNRISIHLCPGRQYVLYGFGVRLLASYTSHFSLTSGCGLRGQHLVGGGRHQVLLPLVSCQIVQAGVGLAAYVALVHWWYRMNVHVTLQGERFTEVFATYLATNPCN